MDRPHLPQRSTINQAPNDDASQAGSVVEEIGSIPTSGRFPETRKRPCEEPSTEEIFTKRIKDVQRISEVEEECVGDLDPLDPNRIASLYQTQNKAQYGQIIKLRKRIQELEKSNEDSVKALSGVSNELGATKKLCDENLKIVNTQRLLIEKQDAEINLLQKTSSAAQSDSSKHKLAKEKMLAEIRKLRDNEVLSQQAIGELETRLEKESGRIKEMSKRIACLEKEKVSARDCSNKNKRNNETLRREVKVLEERNNLLEQSQAPVKTENHKLKAEYKKAIEEKETAQTLLGEEKLKNGKLHKEMESIEEWKLQMNRLASLGPGKWKTGNTEG